MGNTPVPLELMRLFPLLLGGRCNYPAEPLIVEAPKTSFFFVSETSCCKGIPLRSPTMSEQPGNESKDGSDLGRAGQERLEGTIAPPQVGSGFIVDPTVRDSI